MAEKKETGYVYICTNPSFREDWIKIGKTSRDPRQRIKEFYKTSLPLPFELYASIQSTKYDKIEKLVHRNIDRLSDLRVNKDREFFNLTPELALEIFQDIAETLDDAVITLYRNNEPIPTEETNPKPAKPIKVIAYPAEPIKPTTPTASEQAPHGEISTAPKVASPFRFSMVGIELGTLITFIPTGQEVQVVSDNEIAYNGKTYTLSGFTREFMPNHLRNKSNIYRGPDYFSYQGEKLTKLREKQGEISPIKDLPQSVSPVTHLPKTKNKEVVPPKPSKPSTSEADKQTEHNTKKPFRFSMIGIELGTLVTFIPTGEEVQVVSDNEVQHNGKTYTLSGFTREFMPNHLRNKSNIYRGPKYFSFQGKTLTKLREEREQED